MRAVILLLILSFSASAQTTAFNMLQKLIPDTGKPATFASAQSATKGVVQWEVSKPRFDGVAHSCFGAAKVTYGVKILCGGKACETSVQLSGKSAAGFEEITLTLAPDELPSVFLEKLLGKTGYQAKVLKKELDGVGGLIYYELQLPGKPLVWVQVMTVPAYREEQSNDFSLTVFLTKKGMLSRM